MCCKTCRDQDDAHVFHSGEGKHPLVVVDLEKQECGDPDREEAYHHHPVPNARLRRRQNDGEKPQNHIKGYGGLDPGQHGAYRRGCLAMGVGQPGMHGCEADFCPESHKHQQKRELEQIRRHGRRHRGEGSPGLCRSAAAAVVCPVQHQKSKQRDRRSHNGQDGHFPCGFKCASGTLVSYQ